MKKHNLILVAFFAVLSVFALMLCTPCAQAETKAKKQPVEVTKHGLDPMKIQEALKAAGVYDGPVDGTLGKKTRMAIRKFQEKNGLKPDGVCGQKTWDLLKTNLTDSTSDVSGLGQPASTSGSLAGTNAGSTTDEFSGVGEDLSTGYPAAAAGSTSKPQNEDLRKKLVS